MGAIVGRKLTDMSDLAFYYEPTKNDDIRRNSTTSREENIVITSPAGARISDGDINTGSVGVQGVCNVSGNMFTSTGVDLSINFWVNQTEAAYHYFPLSTNSAPYFKIRHRGGNFFKFTSSYMNIIFGYKSPYYRTNTVVNYKQIFSPFALFAGIKNLDGTMTGNVLLTDYKYDFNTWYNVSYVVQSSGINEVSMKLYVNGIQEGFRRYSSSPLTRKRFVGSKGKFTDFGDETFRHGNMWIHYKYIFHTQPNFTSFYNNPLPSVNEVLVPFLYPNHVLNGFKTFSDSGSPKRQNPTVEYGRILMYDRALSDLEVQTIYNNNLDIYG